ncbi:MAG TPA: hypothetical protein VGN83_23255 [Falsiroseomonas sp.]|jgi:hypothetical protein|nr:hypothetical protein [Falsiroseomonas sp.]
MRVDYYCLPQQDKVWRDINELSLACGRPGGAFRIHAHKPGAALCWHPYNMLPIGRVAGEDPLGLLYIGAARHFCSDFIALWVSLRTHIPEVADHPVAQAFRRSEALSSRFQVICFTLCFSLEPHAAADAELAAYEAAYGEPPPLQQVVGRQRDAIAAIA